MHDVDFAIDEIFFSRTDERGVVLAGNDVFQRLSGYEWTELIGAPHKIIRHPEMPKAVYHLFWEKLKKGEHVIAYIRNRAKDGGQYWVLAFAIAVDGGYVSVRVKPVSEIFAKVVALYDELLKDETENGWSAEEHGHSKLVEGLSAMGYESYEDFSNQVAMAEMLERNAQLKRISNPIYGNLASVSKTVTDLKAKVAELAEIFQRIRTTPVNLGIMANRIERSGGPISAISGIYSSMSAEIGDWLDGFLKRSDEAFARMRSDAGDCLTIVATAEISNEILTTFEFAAASDVGFDHHDEIVRLKKRSRTSARNARSAVAGIRNDAMDLQNATHVLKRHVMSLSSTRVLCEIESAKLQTRSESLEGVVAQLADFQDEIEEIYKDIAGATQSIIASLSANVFAEEEEKSKAA